MVANVPLWVTCAVLSNVIGLAFALTALARLGWNPFQSLKRLLCCLGKRGAESGIVQGFQSDATGKDQVLICSGEEERKNAGKGAAETLEDGNMTISRPTTSSGLSLAFLRARARAASGLTKDDAISSSAPQEFHGGVMGQPWQRGCACEVSLNGLGIDGAEFDWLVFFPTLAFASLRRQAANFLLLALYPLLVDPPPLSLSLSPLLSVSHPRAHFFRRH